MKLTEYFSELTPVRVAPRRGAWVETSVVVISSLLGVVAPRRGAWVETV